MSPVGVDHHEAGMGRHYKIFLFKLEERYRLRRGAVERKRLAAILAGIESGSLDRLAVGIGEGLLVRYIECAGLASFVGKQKSDGSTPPRSLHRVFPIVEGAPGAL